MEVVLLVLALFFGGSAIIENKAEQEYTVDSHVSKWEGYRSNAYQDVGGIWTVGYGQITIDGESVTEADTTTEPKARVWMMGRIAANAAYVHKYAEAKGYEWNNYQVAALTSFTYNLGRGKLNQLARGGSRSNEQIAQAMTLYTKAGGVEWQGLINRRTAEVTLFNK